MAQRIHMSSSYACTYLPSFPPLHNKLNLKTKFKKKKTQLFFLQLINVLFRLFKMKYKKTICCPFFPLPPVPRAAIAAAAAAAVINLKTYRRMKILRTNVLK